MNQLRQIPELVALRTGQAIVRIPPEIDVPLTARIRRLVDSAGFRRLGNISQLGLVRLVYPGATHTRFEHSLGAYRNALLFLDRLAEDPRFVERVDRSSAEKFLVAALLHDIGHWPFCHPIEDLALPGAPSHEASARDVLVDTPIDDALQADWGLSGADVADLLLGQGADPARAILSSLLSGPIDVDKMDYLVRDSLHAGVPYGRHFDSQRLIQSLCLSADGAQLAITEKGRTAAEMMVFARYVMFSEVYWHHAVRSATAMLQRAVFALTPKVEIDDLIGRTDGSVIEVLRSAARANGGAAALVEGLFGPTRQLYKRIGQYSLYEHREVYECLARRPYPWLVNFAGRLAERVSAAAGVPVSPSELLVDAPPAALEVQFEMDVYFPKADRYRTLGEISPVVRTLAKEQFDDYVKRVRLFAHPKVADALRGVANFEQLVADAAQRHCEDN